MKAIVLNALYSSGRNFLAPMLFSGARTAGCSKAVDAHRNRDFDLLEIPDDILVHGHFLLGSESMPYYKMLYKDYHHIFLYRDLRDCLVSGMNYDRNCSVTAGRPLNAILNGMDELQALKYILREQREVGVQGHHLFMLKDAMETARRCLRDKSICSLSFESLKTDTANGLRIAFTHMGFTVNEAALKQAVEAGSFERKSGGRTRGVEDKTSLCRKGISGDWKNYFDDELKDMFKELTGSFLKETGYERDDNW